MTKNLTVQSGTGKFLLRKDFLRKYGALLVLAGMLIINIVVTPNFVSVGTIWNIIIQCCTIILTGMGMTMVISSGGIDISVGSIMAAGAMAVGKLLPLGMAPAILGALFLCAAFGAFNGFMISKLRVQPMIMTLTMLMAVRGIAQLMNDAMLLPLKEFTSFAVIGNYKLGGQLPIQFFFILFAILLVYFIMEKMSLGRYIQSAGDNPFSARLSGINTVATIITVYMFSGLFAGAAGIVEASRVTVADASSVGRLAELDAIAAVAVGGTSMKGGRAHVLGTIIGALIMQLITISVNMNNIPYEIAQIIKAMVIIVAVFLQREKER
jgi:ribose transport system permease protein